MSGSSPEATPSKAKKIPDIALICAVCGALFSLLIFLFMLKQERDMAMQKLQLEMSDAAARIEQQWVRNLQNLQSLQAYSVMVEQINSPDLVMAISNIVQSNSTIEAVLWQPIDQKIGQPTVEAVQRFDLPSVQNNVQDSSQTSIDSAALLALKPDSASVPFWFANTGRDADLRLLAGARSHQQDELVIVVNFAAMLSAASFNQDSPLNLATSAALTLVDKNTGELLYQQGEINAETTIQVEYPLQGATPWQLRFSVTPEYLSQHTSFTPALFLLTGLLFSFLFASYIKRIKLHLKALRKEQDILSQQLQESSCSDLETGLAGKSHFDEVLDVECRRAVREFSPLTVMLIELDAFVAFRNHYGDEQANQVLREVASLLIESVGRPGDMVARVDDHRFALMLPSTNELVSELAERCCSCILGLNTPHEAAPNGSVLSASIGVSTLQPSRLMTAARMLDTAVQQLRTAQESGGNQYSAYAEGMQEPSMTYSV